MISTSNLFLKKHFHCLGTLTSLLCFHLFYGIATALYPGGTWQDHSTVGHSFWHNYLCDVMSATSLNGMPNPGSSYGLIAYGCLLIALLFWWMLLAKMTEKYSPILAKGLLSISLLSVATSFLAIVVFPAEEKLFSYHFVFTSLTLLFGLCTTFFPFVYFLSIAPCRFLGKAGVLLTSPVAVGLCCYMAQNLGLQAFQNNDLIIGLSKVSIITITILCLLSCYKQVQNVVAREHKVAGAKELWVQLL